MSRRRRALALVLVPLLAGAWLLMGPRPPEPRVSTDEATVAPVPPPVVLPAEPPVAAAPRPERHPYQDFLDALVREFPFGRERQAALREMLEEAPPEAIESLLRLCFGDETLNDISHVLIERLARVAPERAVAFAREMRFGIEPPWWHSVIGGLARPADILPDILALPVSEARTRYLGHMSLQLGLADPDAALRFALVDAPPEAREPAVANAVLAASRRDPHDGFERALVLAPGLGEVGLIQRVAVDWALADYDAASARILGMDEGASRQAALVGLAAAAIARDPESALPLIAEVGDAAVRESLWVDAGKQLFLKNPGMARAWLDENRELGATSRATLREFAERTAR